MKSTGLRDPACTCQVFVANGVTAGIYRRRLTRMVVAKTSRGLQMNVRIDLQQFWSAWTRTLVTHGSEEPMARARIGLALGSGAARGWAHIGVLEALKKPA